MDTEHNFKDVFGLGCPDKGLQVFVVMFYIIVDCDDEFRHMSKDDQANSMYVYVPQESLDHVQPGRAGEHEVEVESPMQFHPLFGFRVLVRRVVVKNQANLVVLRGFPIDSIQKPDEFLVTLADSAFRDERAVKNFRFGEETRGYMPFVGMRHCSGTPALQRQSRL